MNDRQKLYEFTEILERSLNIVKTANEIPEYILSKARDITPEQTCETLMKYGKNMDLLKTVAGTQANGKISKSEECATKKDLYNLISETQAALDNLKGPHYRLMLSRFIAAAKLADEVQEVLENLLKAEQELKEMYFDD